MVPNFRRKWLRHGAVAVGLVGAAFCIQPVRSAETVTLMIPGMIQRLRIHVVKPPIDAPGKTLPIVLALPPGAGGPKEVRSCLARYWEKEALKRKVVVVCPEMRGQDFARASFRLLPSVLTYAIRRCGGDRKRVVVAGNSNGGVGAYGCFMKHPDRFVGLLVFPGGPTGRVEFTGDLSSKQAYVLVGENDEQWLKASRQIVDSLRAAGVSVRFEVVPGQGHALDVSPAKLFDWIEQAVGGNQEDR